MMHAPTLHATHGMHVAMYCRGVSPEEKAYMRQHVLDLISQDDSKVSASQLSRKRGTKDISKTSRTQQQLDP